MYSNLQLGDDVDSSIFEVLVFLVWSGSAAQHRSAVSFFGSSSAVIVSDQAAYLTV